jgi:energy-converting hydrogenase Eha subunit C
MGTRTIKNDQRVFALLQERIKSVPAHIYLDVEMATRVLQRLSTIADEQQATHGSPPV